MRPILIHHVHLTSQAEHKRGQVSTFTAKGCLNLKPNGILLKSSLKERRLGNPGVGGWVGASAVGVGGVRWGWGRRAVILLHSCQNWQFSFVFCEFTLGMA